MAGVVFFAGPTVTYPRPIIDDLRRLAVVAGVLSRPGVKMVDAAKNAGVTTRTIQRDMRFLQSLGAEYQFDAYTNTWSPANRFDFWAALKFAATE